MSDQDETPRHRKITDSEVRRKVYGVPVTPPREDEQSFDDGDELTSPIDMLDRDPGPEVREVVRLSRRNPGDAATVEDFVSLKKSIDRQFARDHSSSEEAKKVLAMLPSPEELKQMRDAVQKVSFGSVLLKAAAVIAMAASGYVIKEALASAKLGGEIEIKIEHLEHNVDRLLDYHEQERRAAQKDQP